MRHVIAVSLAAFAVLAAGMFAGKTQAAPFCKTLKGESVAFGEPGARKDAEEALDKVLADWSQRYRTPAVPKNRKVTCSVYIEFLDEYACTAEASVCREIRSAPKAAAQPSAAAR